MTRAACAALVPVLLGGSGCVTGDRSAAEPLPPSPPRVHVDLHDYRFEMSGDLPLGRVIVEVANRGMTAHSLTLIDLPEDYPPLDQQLRGDERRGVGTVAQVPARAPGERTRFALDVQPGRYGLVCLVLDADGLTHAQKGMNREFRVR